MIVKFWGTRGTFPVPGPNTVRYGGDTTCVSVETKDRVLVLDAGTGIRTLGESLLGDSREIAVLFTHLHADHVMGFPFFKPLYDKERPVSVLDHRLGDVEWSARELLDGKFFPLTAEQLPCDVRWISDDPVAFLGDFGFELSRTQLNHPGGAYGYRVGADGASFVFIPDNEVDPPMGGCTDRPSLIEFCEGADLVAHDAQFTTAEMEHYNGWGHSTVAEATDLGVDAGARMLVLTHHDPRRTDDQLDDLQAEAIDRAGSSRTDVVAAFDGLEIPL